MTAAPEIKYSDRDVREDSHLMDLAVAYVSNYTGEFEPLVDARCYLEDEGELTTPMARKVLNCMRHDARVSSTLPPPIRSNVLEFLPPRERRKKVKYDEAQCDSTESHHSHNWGEDREHRCTGVPWAINRGEARVVATIKVPYAASRTGSLIHDVHPDGPHRTIWQGPQHAWGYRTDERPYYRTDADLIVKLRCKFPSYLDRPILIRAKDVKDFMELNAFRASGQIKMCPHCEKSRTGE